MTKFKADLSLMTLGEQDTWESLANCRLIEISKVGLVGRRLAALIYVFELRENKNAKFEDYLNLNMEQASEYLEDAEEEKKGEKA